MEAPVPPSGGTATATASTTTSTTPPVAPHHHHCRARPATRSEVGNLTYPDNVTAVYEVPGTGQVGVTATWSGTPDLTSPSRAPTGRRTAPAAPASTVTVPAPAAGDPGTCSVTIAEPTGVEATVSYTLAVTSGPGGQT